jgi:DNA excision repair protein ERCC-3
MVYQPSNPMIIQSDLTILLEVDNPAFRNARDLVSQFCELIKSPEHIHTYSISKLSLWNAIANGIKKEDILLGLQKYTKFDIPSNILYEIKDAYTRYGEITLLKDDENFILQFKTESVYKEVLHYKPIKEFILSYTFLEIYIKKMARGRIKQILIDLGYPVNDLAGYKKGEDLRINFRSKTLQNETFKLRGYQEEAISSFHQDGSLQGGNGVIVLPCGAGKTVVAMGVMEKIQEHTIILTTSTLAVKQWIRELIDKTDISPEDIGEYSASKKQIRPVTVTTYQMLTYRSNKTDEFLHMELFNKHNWGLIVYDEVHLLPAPVFRATVEVQSTRRLGLTATLIREDGLETDVFSLIGPKRYDIPWQTLEEKGFISPVKCFEIRVAMSESDRLVYAAASKKEKFRLSSENSKKDDIVQKLIEKHKGEQILVIGQYLDQLKRIACNLNLPLITGNTAMGLREELFNKFRDGDLQIVVVSKVANFAIDLPEASVAIQVSGTYGSRQEEAQRLGRILRPFGPTKQAYFYTIVSRDSSEQDYALHRQLFLTEQGYRYNIYSPGDPILFSKV